MRMALLFYATHLLSQDYQKELQELLHPDLNLQNPVVFDLRELSTEDQEKVLRLIDSFYNDNNLTIRFPYPVYAFTTVHEKSQGVVTLGSEKELPRFFTKRSGKLNVKETHLSEKNALIQREIRNTDLGTSVKTLKDFAGAHKKIYLGEKERLFYEGILERLEKGTK